MSRIDGKCKYMFMFPENNYVCNGLIEQPLLTANLNLFDLYANPVDGSSSIGI